MKSLFRKSKYVQINTSATVIRDQEPNVPSGSWTKCDACGEMIYKDDLKQLGKICPGCGKYFRMSGPERIELIMDKGTFTPLFQVKEHKDPLSFPGYDEKIALLREKTGLDEAVVTGVGQIQGIPVAMGVMDSRFIMGSMGQDVGEKITLLIELATQKGLPLILFTASGGARMQEGILSLMQMAKTSAALKRFNDQGGLYITVLTDPTSGGVTASFAMLGDIILSEPKAFIGFAGPRVIRDTIRQELPDGFQRAEFLQEHGFVDAIIPRLKLKDQLSKLCLMHGFEAVACPLQTAEDQESPDESEEEAADHESVG